jgi:hypothetical protein
MKTSPTIANLASALVQALPTLSNPAFDSVNPTFKTAKNPDGSGYASLAAHISATKSPLAPFGLVVVQFPTSPGPDLVGIETVILHSSGEWISNECSVALHPTTRVNRQTGEPEVVPPTAQNAASATTYLRRYGLAACLGLVGERDDDGEEASNAAPRPSATPYAAPRSAPASTPPPRPAAAPSSGGPRSPAPPVIDGPHLDAVIPFGKNKDQRLRDLSPNSLFWYFENYQPKPYKGRISDKDQALRDALDAAFGRPNPGESAPAPEASEDGVPF